MRDDSPVPPSPSAEPQIRPAGDGKPPGGILGGGPSAGPPRPWLIPEFLVLYAAIPTAAALHAHRLNRYLIPSLIFGGILLLILLRKDPNFDNRLLWNAPALRKWWWRVLLLVLAFAAAAVAGVAVFTPEFLFYLPRNLPYLWIAIVILYPVLSVYPQEIIFRTWFFHRYQRLFPGRWPLIFASAIAFAYAHVMFWNWLAIALTALGGLVFARTYDRSRSTLVVAVEHALYGAVIFTVGIRGFYLGAVSPP
jgi:uncharacterized protein